MKITNISGREIINACGLPALECELVLDNTVRVVASVPSGTSKGAYEVAELRDNQTRLGGHGLLKAIENIERLVAPVLLHQEPDVLALDQKLLELDPTKTKEHLGGNVLLAVSSAVLKAQAVWEDLDPYELVAHFMGNQEVTLPFPLFNMVHGGAHAQNNLRIQEFMVVPAGEHTVRACVETGMMMFNFFEQYLKKAGKLVSVGIEGGFVVNFKDDLEALDMLTELVHATNNSYGTSCALALDVAASQFYNQQTGLYDWWSDQFSSDDMITLYEHLIAQYPIYSIEDGLNEYDWDGWAHMTARLGDVVQLVGDDIFATNPERIAYGIEKNIANAVIIKPNQIGTISQTLQAVALCKERGMATVFSHRSRDTEDTLLVDLAIGCNASQLKLGGLLRGERTAKYNQLLRIEDRLTRALLTGGQ